MDERLEQRLKERSNRLKLGVPKDKGAAPPEAGDEAGPDIEQRRLGPPNANAEWRQLYELIRERMERLRQ